MVILAPFLIHLGALGRHPESNLFCFEAKMGSKMHLNGVSKKSFDFFLRVARGRDRGKFSKRLADDGKRH